MSFLFSITNAVLILFLWSILRSSERNFYFNPYLSAINRVLEKVLDYASPIIPGAPKRTVAIVVFLFLLAFRNLIIPDLATCPLADFGLDWNFLPPSGMPKLAAAMLSGTTRFIQFLFSFWGAIFIIRLVGKQGAESRISQTYDELSAPFSCLRPGSMFAVLVLLNTVLAFTLMHVSGFASHPVSQYGMEAIPIAHAPLGQQVLFSLWLGTAGASICPLLFLQEFLVFFIFMSLFSIIFGRRILATFCQETINLVLGRFSSHPLSLGAFDFTPILFFLGLSFAYSLILQILRLLRPYIFFTLSP